MRSIRDWIEIGAEGIELLAVMIMVGFILAGTVRWLYHIRKGLESGYEHYRITVGKSLLVGLELLVAADIIRTVVLDATLMNLAVLGLLVIIRTVLGWSLTVEIEGRWPWQAEKRTDGKPNDHVPAEPYRDRSNR